MNDRSDIDILLLPEKYGWSLCYIYVSGQFFMLQPTYVFDNPIEILLNGLISLLEGHNATEFVWHDQTACDPCSIR